MKTSKQQRYVIMIPVPLKNRLRQRAADLGVSMRTVMLNCLEGELGTEWRDEVEGRLIPGTQSLFGDKS